MESAIETAESTVSGDCAVILPFPRPVAPPVAELPVDSVGPVEPRPRCPICPVAVVMTKHGKTLKNQQIWRCARCLKQILTNEGTFERAMFDFRLLKKGGRRSVGERQPCTKCGEKKNVVKYGRAKNGRQRWSCRSCGSKYLKDRPAGTTKTVLEAKAKAGLPLLPPLLRWMRAAVGPPVHGRPEAAAIPNLRKLYTRSPVAYLERMAKMEMELQRNQALIAAGYLAETPEAQADVAMKKLPPDPMVHDPAEASKMLDDFLSGLGH